MDIFLRGTKKIGGEVQVIYKAKKKKKFKNGGNIIGSKAMPDLLIIKPQIVFLLV